MSMAVFSQNFSHIAAIIDMSNLNQLKHVWSSFSPWKNQLKRLSLTKMLEKHWTFFVKILIYNNYKGIFVASVSKFSVKKEVRIRTDCVSPNFA
jgi:hypothetical protein